MKRKYFSRGLGLGILVTALLFAFGLLFYKPSLSDDEIRARAILLGMTETSERRTSSAENSSSASASTSERSAAKASSAASSASSSAPASSASSQTSAEPASSAVEPPAASSAVEERPATPPAPEPQPEPEPEPVENPPVTPSEPSATPEPSGNEEPQEGGDSGLYSFTVNVNDSSMRVSEKLYRAGIISDPQDFNSFLERNGYDNYIQTGTYNISPNTSYEAIAHAITNR